LADAGASIRNAIAARFEAYARELLSIEITEAQVEGEISYGTPQHPRKSPDALVFQEGVLRVCIECKSTKLSFNAQFVDNPFADSRAGSAYDEIAKGVYQIWRFQDDLRRGIVDHPINVAQEGIVGVVLTLDDWLEATNDMRQTVFERAGRLADASGIPRERRAPVSICTIRDLEFLLRTASLEDLVHVFTRSVDPDRFGWHLPSLLAEVQAGDRNVRPFPFEADFVRRVGWWDEIVR